MEDISAIAKNVVVFPVYNNIWNKQYKNTFLLTFYLADTPSFIKETVLRMAFEPLGRAAKIKQTTL